MSTVCESEGYTTLATAQQRATGLSEHASSNISVDKNCVISTGKTVCQPMDLAVRNFEIGQMVYSKIVGYPPWPSCIIDFQEKNGKQVAVVRYFGWNGEKSYLSFNKLTPLECRETNPESILRQTKKVHTCCRSNETNNQKCENRCLKTL